MTDELRLVPFEGERAGLVVGWCESSVFSREWVPSSAESAGAVLAGWLEDPDISGYLLVRSGTPVAYGELWVEPEGSEAELAHLVVDPAVRRQGLGRALAGALVDRARANGLTRIFLRVHDGNSAAVDCYASAGFERCPPEEEAAYNAGQPAAYRWMQHLPRG